ncbi:MAG TPA: hypothetical protein VGB55_11425 [Tepidisphaeraceae bacterium]|jgi:hypothetical protein
MATGDKPKLTVADISAPSEQPDTKADQNTKVERLYLEAAYPEQLARLSIEDLKQDIRERKAYADRIFRLISLWLAGVFWLVIAAGWTKGEFKLSDRVLITLLGATTASVIGLFVIVANYLFPKSGSRSAASRIEAYQPVSSRRRPPARRPATRKKTKPSSS